ncbi:FtsX-like permease family protein [Streptomyces sp. fd1-xmd]|uniref:FtsX-like permease family protein n=1 Tax=Streptomyces sp. fd1-xmd TaxID=1812480 RepID=UPI0009909FCD|nr:FtsX-like permease family protein [Streptomyces sp. fd1-xmd]AQT74895.1 ABC transporter permease [Streptomyces sp. fd1-xmd]
MWSVSVRTVRHYWALFAGTFVALALGVALIGVSAAALASTWAVDRPAASGPQVTLTDGTGAARTLSAGELDLGGVQSVLAMAGVISAFVTLFVIAGTCAFGIALRRRDMGLLRLVGAGAGQVRRMVLAESLVVAVPAALLGALAAVPAAPVVVEALNGTGLTPVELRPGPLLGPLVFAVAAGLVIAVLGVVAASRRAAAVRPTEALREADLDTRAMTAGRAVTGLLLLAGGVVAVRLAPGAGAEAATPLALFGTMALAVAATVLGPLYLPPLLRLLALPLRAFDPVAGRLATAALGTSRRRTASLVGPVLSVVAVVGVFTTVLSTTGAATAADDRARTAAQLVVEPEGGRTGLTPDQLAVLRADPRVAAVSAPAALEVAVAGPHSVWKDQAAVADPVDLARTHRIAVTDGPLGPLQPGTVAVSREFADWYGKKAGGEVTYGVFGGRPVTARVAAVLDGGSAVPHLLLPPGADAGTAAAPDRAYVLLKPEAAGAAAGAARWDGMTATPTERWFADRSNASDRLNRLVLLVLTGPASLYALIAVAGTLVMAYSRRGREVSGLKLVGVSAGQIRRMALWEALGTTLAGVALAAAVVAFGAGSYRQALPVLGGEAELSVPWPLLGSLAGACLAVAVTVGLAAAGRLLRGAGVASLTSRQ